MTHEGRKPRKLTITNPDREMAISGLDSLIEEWRKWQSVVAQIQDQPYDTNTQSDIYADGADNLKHHTILQEKTLTFLDQNIEGHNFIFGFDGNHVDRDDLRLKVRVDHRLKDLDILKACIASTADLAPKQVEWIRTADAVEMLAPVLSEFTARRRICERAHGGMIRARAEQYHHGPRVSHSHDIPKDFWWAEGHAALEQDWAVGDFSTWINHSIHLKAFGVTFAFADIQKLLPPIGNSKSDSQAHSNEDNAIIELLRELVPSAALSYKQAILDLADKKRVSFRGPALEFREALREALDFIAPDSEVIAAQGYVQEKDRTGPTMKQKVRFIMKKKGALSSSGAPEQAVTAFEEAIAALTRDVYTRSSRSTHVAGGREAVAQLRRYMVAILHDILGGDKSELESTVLTENR
jgi:hypothetical protein